MAAPQRQWTRWCLAVLRRGRRPMMGGGGDGLRPAGSIGSGLSWGSRPVGVPTSVTRRSALSPVEESGQGSVTAVLAATLRLCDSDQWIICNLLLTLEFCSERALAARR